MPSYTLHPIRGNILILSIRTSLSLGWNAIVVPERREVKKFTAASTLSRLNTTPCTPVTHLALFFPSTPTGEHRGHRGQLVWLIVAACRLCVWQHEGTSFGCCAGVSGKRSWVQGLRERQWVTEDVLVLRGDRATETEAGSVAVLLNDHIVQQSMFDEYYVVLCGTYRTTSTNECDHNNKYTYFIIARPPSLLLLLSSMIIFCFDVMNTLVHV